MQSKIGCPCRACSLPCDRRQHRQLVDVGAGDERLLARAGQHDRAHARVVLERRHGARQLGERLAVSALRTLGRLRVTMATAPSRSIRRLSKVMRLPPHDTPRPCGAEAGRRAGRVVPDVAPLGKTRRHVHLDPLHADAVKHRDRERRDHRAARHAGPAARGQWRAASTAPARCSAPACSTVSENQLLDRRRHVRRGRRRNRSRPCKTGAPGSQRLDHNGEEAQQPAEHDRGADERAEHLGAERQLLLRRVLRDRREDDATRRTRTAIIRPKWLVIYLRPRRTS